MLKFENYISENFIDSNKMDSNKMESNLEYLDIDVICDLKKFGFESVDHTSAKIQWNFKVFKKKNQVNVDVFVTKIYLMVIFIDMNANEVEKEYTFFGYSDIANSNSPEKLPITISHLEVNLNTNMAKVEFA